MKFQIWARLAKCVYVQFKFSTQRGHTNFQDQKRLKLMQKYGKKYWDLFENLVFSFLTHFSPYIDKGLFIAEYWYLTPYSALERIYIIFMILTINWHEFEYNLYCIIWVCLDWRLIQKSALSQHAQKPCDRVDISRKMLHSSWNR